MSLISISGSEFHRSGSDSKMVAAGTIVDRLGYPFLVNPMSASWIYDDFTSGATTGNLGWSAIAANSGTVAVTTGNALNPGLIRLGTATSNNAQSALRLGVSQILLGSARMLTSWKFIVNTAATVAEDWVFRVGLHDSTTGDPTDGVYTSINRAVSGNYLVTNTASNTSITSTVMDGTSGNPTFAVADGSIIDCLADINQAASSVTFYARLQGSSLFTTLKTHSTNIPSGAGRQTSPCAALIKTAGTGSTVNLDLDWYWHHMKFSEGAR